MTVVTFLSCIVIVHFVKLDKITVKERWQHLIIKFKHEFGDFHLKHIFNFQYFDFRIQGGRWIISRTEKTSSEDVMLKT